MKNIELLLIEDNPDDVEILKELFADAGYSTSGFVHADELSAGIELLNDRSFEIILLDMSLPDSCGADTFFSIHEKATETPIIIITGNRNEEMIGELLQNGAQDYWIKGAIDPDALSRSIYYSIERQRLLVKLKRKTDEVQALQQSLEHIVTNNADAIMVIDSHGVIRFANPAAAEIFNRDQKEMLGSDFGFSVSTERALEIDVVRRDGRAAVAELRAVEITWEGEPAHLASIRDITEQKNLQNEMQRLSFYDSLTGLYNRAYFNEEAQRLDNGRNYPLCLIMGDVNNLKLVNDALGHNEGDRLLISVALVLKQACRKNDIVVRLGGDEFAVLLTKCDEVIATRVVNSIKTLCENIPSESIPVSIALGMAVKNTPEQSIHDLMNRADERMYVNKLSAKRGKYSSFLSSLEKSLCEKDYVTAEHAVRVRELATRFGTELRLNDFVIDELSLLASLHDIGKIVIPESILKKPGPLTPGEWEIVRKHPVTGYRITRVTYGMNAVAEDILSHHERWDGSGYPHGLKGDQIPIASRLLSIVDTFDVMTHDRPYKKAFTNQQALDEIYRCRGTQFDPQLADAFLGYFDKLTASQCVAASLKGQRPAQDKKGVPTT